ncbi:MAG: site-specific integrase [Rhodoblastus sp.]
MARTVRDTNLETRTARLRLTPRRKPYWRVLESGLHVGYRRTKEGGGTWVARRFMGEGRYIEKGIGTADDLQDADGEIVQSFTQAQDAAREWWRLEQRKERGLPKQEGPYTVSAALDDYFAEQERKGKKGVAKDRSAADLRIVPALGAIELAKLTWRRIREWHSGIVTARLAKLPEADQSDPEAIRAARSTANRTLTILKAALNFAYHEGHSTTDEPWRKVKPFKGADTAKVRFLTDAESLRLANACEKAFRNLVRGALLTGCRYGELTRMQAGDFTAESRTITVRESKSEKPRHVALTDEGAELFARLTAGKTGRALIFVRDDGAQWGASHQQRPLKAASARAKIEPAATFHLLRHTYASALAMRGVPMGVIAAQLGHKDTRMTEKHYAHLAPNYVADTVRAALPRFGFVEPSNVTALKKSGGSAA